MQGQGDAREPGPLPRPGGSRAAQATDLALASGAAPGIQYLVVDGTSARLDAAGGWADVAGRRPLRPDTTTMIYSMTKTFTAAAVLQLVERGAVALEEPASTYLPGFPYGDRVTVRHLLSQTSGIPNPIPLRWVHTPGEHASYDESATLAKVLARYPRLAFEPGARYAYSNISYWLLGRVVERASGKSYQDFMAENVFGPLGLPREEIDFVIHAPERHAKGYLPRLSLMTLAMPFLVDRKFVGAFEGPWLHVRDNYLDGAAFGGIVASARAVAAFLSDQLRERSALLAEETRRLFFTRQRNNAGELVETTLGWHVGRAAGAPFFFKEGGGAGFHGEMRIYRGAGIASVAVGNSGSFRVKRFLDSADREFLG